MERLDETISNLFCKNSLTDCLGNLFQINVTVMVAWGCGCAGVSYYVMSVES